MSRKLDKQAYLALIKPRYQRASKQVKSQILDEFCLTCQYNRKYAIWLLKQPVRRLSKAKQKPGPKARYQDEMLVKALERIWYATDLMCSKRLKSAIPHWLPFYQKHYEPLSKTVQENLLAVSTATIDRLLKPTRDRIDVGRRCGTKPGTLLRSQIPIRTSCWDIELPGFVEADTVAHCGDSIRGDFAWSLTVTDIKSSWTEIRAIWNKGAQAVLEQVEDIEAHLPFILRGFDSDNGVEFLNYHLVDYFNDHEPKVQFTRSRPYKKNDNAHVEQKNWTHVRHLFGYARFGKLGVVKRMNELYRNEWRLYQNFFMPNLKILEKQRINHRYYKKYHKPLTPCQRLLDDPYISKMKKDELIDQYYALDPFELKQQIDQKKRQINRFLGLA